jgi:hypothetical protein
MGYKSFVVELRIFVFCLLDLICHVHKKAHQSLALVGLSGCYARSLRLNDALFFRFFRMMVAPEVEVERGHDEQGKQCADGHAGGDH